MAFTNIFGTDGNDNNTVNGVPPTFHPQLNGTRSNDNMNGNGGADILLGGPGNDTLRDDDGNDRLEGGIGDDLYFVGAGRDQIVEAADAGTDLVIPSSVSFTLPENVENLQLAFESSALNGTGNAGNNSITGNENDNTLKGLAGDDVLDGLGGNDTLIGGTGADSFTFSFVFNQGIDIIQDFVVADDSIQVTRFAGDGLSAGAISADQFVLGSAAADADDQFIYNNGALFFDPDGTGTADQVQFATLTGAPTLSAADIVIF